MGVAHPYMAWRRGGRTGGPERVHVARGRGLGLGLRLFPADASSIVSVSTLGSNVAIARLLAT